MYGHPASSLHDFEKKSKMLLSAHVNAEQQVLEDKVAIFLMLKNNTSILLRIHVRTLDSISKLARRDG